MYCDNQNKTCSLIKQTLIALGENTRGAWNTSDPKCHNILGINMATPNATGVFALMICANPKAE